MRDVQLADTFFILFTTRAFATGIPTVLANTPVISAYEDDNLVQITAGVTLTVDHDGVVGLNRIQIVATGANGFENLKSYHLVITTGEVATVSVIGEVVGEFSIGASAAAQDLANGTDGLTAIKAETALIVADTNELQVDDIPSLLPAALVGGRIDASLDAVGFEAAAVDLIWDELLAGHVVADSTGELLNDWQNGGRLDAILDLVALEATVAALNDVSTAEVLTQVNTALDTAISELGVAAPAVTPTIRTAVMLLYMALRNKLDVQTSATDALELHNDAGTQITSKLLTDDGSDYSEAKMT